MDQRLLDKKISSEWRVVNLNPFKLSSTINFGSDLANMPILGMEFKGFCARRSNEANPEPMEKPVLAVAKDRRKGTCLDGSDTGLIERKPLEATSNFSPRKDNHLSSALETEV